MPLATSVECFRPIHSLRGVGVVRYASPAVLMKHCDQLATYVDVAGCEFGAFCGCVDVWALSVNCVWVRASGGALPVSVTTANPFLCSAWPSSITSARWNAPSPSMPLDSHRDSAPVSKALASNSSSGQWISCEEGGTRWYCFFFSER